MAIKEIKLNAQNFDTMKKFAMVQGDSARVLRCYVDLDLSTVTEARIYIKKADGTEIYNDCIVTNQYIDAPLTTQALAIVGDQVAQLHLKDGSGYITTYKFILQVLKSYISGSAIESSNEFTALENALAKVEEFKAENINYDNEESGLEANNVQSAIDELTSDTLYVEKVKSVPIDTLNTTDKTVEGAINELSIDFIVEQGKIGGWTYRKWNGGIVECWGENSYTANLSATTGNYYTQSATGTAKSFPTNLFVSAPIVRPSVTSSAYLNATPATVTKDNFTLNLFGGYKYTSTAVKIHIYAIGAWK